MAVNSIVAAYAMATSMLFMAGDRMSVLLLSKLLVHLLVHIFDERISSAREGVF